MLCADLEVFHFTIGNSVAKYDAVKGDVVGNESVCSTTHSSKKVQGGDFGDTEFFCKFLGDVVFGNCFGGVVDSEAFRFDDETKSSTFGEVNVEEKCRKLNQTRLRRVFWWKFEVGKVVGCGVEDQVHRSFMIKTIRVK